MNPVDDAQQRLVISRLVRLGVLQSASLMNLSAAIMRIEGVPREAFDEAYEVFSGIQGQLDILKEIQDQETVNVLRED
ncbi:hypothetical protein HX866_11315 [Pseudomonas gingeri]|uniref:hypothetical protein n=1 Tax=Pseudomonas gingeri TaxID=117681 RepID=UPI0015A3C38C|nr:hypothetical protein [Pseudomonas gingeri]NWA25485.1 hypothetical protein [Pseudomonas gingeri]